MTSVLRVDVETASDDAANVLEVAEVEATEVLAAIVELRVEEAAVVDAVELVKAVLLTSDVLAAFVLNVDVL